MAATRRYSGRDPRLRGEVRLCRCCFVRLRRCVSVVFGVLHRAAVRIGFCFLLAAGLFVRFFLLFQFALSFFVLEICFCHGSPRALVGMKGTTSLNECYPAIMTHWADVHLMHCESATWMVGSVQVFQALARHVRVNLGGGDIGMPQQQLHHPQVGAMVQ
jgi:hypothetical protein